jgi:hypothetical protein
VCGAAHVLKPASSHPGYITFNALCRGWISTYCNLSMPLDMSHVSSKLCRISATRVFYMSNPQLYNPRKCQRKESPIQRNEASQPESKRQKHSHQLPRSHPPPVYWDKLSKIWLTKDALRELERRNTQSIVRSSHTHYQRAHKTRLLLFLHLTFLFRHSHQITRKLIERTWTTAI